MDQMGNMNAMGASAAGAAVAPAPGAAGSANKVCVEIELDKSTGQISVGVCPPEQEMGEKDYMSNAKSLDQALAVARDLLTGSMQGAAQRAQQPPPPNPGQAAFR